MKGHAVAERGARWQGWLAEVPWVAGVVVGWALLVDRGRAFVFMRAPAGFDWAEYLQAAWMVVHRSDAGYPAFRNPLYPWLLGTLGECIGSYPFAGLLLASAGTFAIVLAAGLGARSLATPWAGALAALSVPLVHDTAIASRWVNLYPLLGGTTGLTVAFALTAARRPRPGMAFAAGVSGALAWGIDNRALPVVAACALLVLLGAIPRGTGRAKRESPGHQPAGAGARAGPRPVRAGLRPIVLLVAYLLPLAAGPVSQRVLAVAPRRPLEQQVELQRENDLRGILGSGVSALADACRDEPRFETPSLAAFRRPCAAALLSYNLETLPARFPFRLRWTLWLMPLMWLPARRGWRAAAAGVVTSVVAVAPIALLSLWVMVPDRYVLQFAAPIAMVVPVGLSRLVETWAPRGLEAWLVPGITLGAAWVVVFHVDHGRSPPPLHKDGRYRALAALLARLDEVLGPDDVLLDCSARGIETALLPAMYHAPPPNLTGTDTVRCMAWLDHPEATRGRQWVVTGVRCPFPPAPPGSAEAGNLDRCRSCYAVPGPSMDLPCPHGKTVGQCPLCRNATVPRGTWVLENWYYSGYSCIDTLLLFRHRTGTKPGNAKIGKGEG